MTQHIEESTVRKYLLGILEGEEPRRRVEERLLLDPDFWGELEMAEDDLIDDYVRGALDAGEREGFERHFLKSPERQEKLAFARALDQRLPPPPEQTHAAAPEPTATASRPPSPAPRRFSWLHWPKGPSYVTAAALAVIVLVATVLVWRVFFRRSEVSEGLAAMRAAYGDVRPVESRVTGFDYGRRPETRGPEGDVADADARRRAELLLSGALKTEPGPDALHALGRLYLYERNFDEAVRYLEAAAAETPDDARIQNDLGAALLERGSEAHARRDEEKAALDFGKSFKHLNRALELNPSLKDALFNRAILYENTTIDTRAEEEWRAYLEKDADPASPWAAEARQRLSRLEEQRRRGAVDRGLRFEKFTEAFRARDADRGWEPLGRSRSREGNGIVKQLLDTYFERHEAGRVQEAAEALEMLSFAGVVEERKSGDRFTSDLARFYRGAGPARLRAVAHARSLVRQGDELFNRSELDRARALYAEARLEFERSGDTCEALLAEQSEGLCHLRIPDVKNATETFERLVETSQSRGYAALRAQSLHALSDASTSAGDSVLAFRYADRALELSEKIGYGEIVVRCWQAYASLYKKPTSRPQSLAASLRGISLARENAPGPKLVWPLYAEAAANFAALEMYGAALAFEQEALRLALQSKWPTIIERSYARLGRLHAAMGNLDEAVRVALRAVEQGEVVEDERSRNNLVANAMLRLGDVYHEAGENARALECYDHALNLYEELGLKIYDLDAHKGKLFAYEALGDDDAAAKELDTLFARLEVYRRMILEAEKRDAFFNASQGVYDAAVEFAFTRRKDPRTAFNYAEKSHGRTLRDLMHSNVEEVVGPGARDLTLTVTTEALSLDEVERRMPASTQLLQYHVLEDRLLVWLVSPGEMEAREVGLKGEELARKVKDYGELIEKGADDGLLSVASKELYDLLIAPIESSLDPTRQLCIVPDKSLHLVSFASLVSPSTGRRLIEGYTLIQSPGASIFIVKSEAARAMGHAANETLLSVGNPTFDRVRYDRLSALPSAAREAREVAALYGARPLVGTQAGKEEVLAAMRDADVIQLALHYVTDNKSPLLSRLLLAHRGGPGGAGGTADGELQAVEVYRMKLPRARVVVLSACRTMGERVYEGEGAVGIARSFIAAGAPLVVASLWPVESGPTADLMISFHRHRKLGGLTTAEAFRRAQLDMLSSPDPLNRQPRHWAAFTVIGGYADF